MDSDYVGDIDEFNFKLSPGERQNHLWLKIRDQLERRLARERARNDNMMTPDQTAQLRGQIACLKSIIDFGKEPPPYVGEDESGRRRPTGTRRE